MVPFSYHASTSTTALNNFSSESSTSSTCPRWFKNTRNHSKNNTAADSAFVPGITTGLFLIVKIKLFSNYFVSKKIMFKIVIVSSNSADDDLIDLASDMDLDASMSSTSSTTTKQILFNIHFDQKIFDIRLPSTATIGKIYFLFI